MDVYSNNFQFHLFLIRSAMRNRLCFTPCEVKVWKKMADQFSMAEAERQLRFNYKMAKRCEWEI